MILVKIFIFCISALCLVAGITTILSPDVNTIFIPIVAETIQEAHFVRTYAGFIACYWIFVYEIFIFIIKSSSRLNMLIYNSGDVGF